MGKLSSYATDSSPTTDDLVPTIDSGSGTNRKTTLASLISLFFNNIPAGTLASGWSALGYTPNTITANGNGSYTLGFNGVDLTGTLSPGMRLKFTRTVAAPTQCTSLNGTTQYYSKTAPAGFSFTNLFTCMGWIKPTAYGAIQTIFRKGDASNGLCLRINAAGQLDIFGGNAGSFDEWNSYQSVPLNKWTHVAATLDCSGNVSNMYFNGIAVPCFQTANSITAIVNSGNLALGATPLAAEFFTGKFEQVAVFSAVLSQATIQSYYSQGLAGTEPSIVSAWSFNNSINDLNANANNLTPNGSAVATTVDAPWTQQAGGTPNGTTDFGIITASSFSTNTTLTVQVPEGCTIPTSGGVSAASYSSVKAPYGMPTEEGRWTLSGLFYQSTAQGSPVNNTWYNIANVQLNIPIGGWDLVGQFTATSTKGSASNNRFFVAISPSSSTPTDSEMIQWGGGDLTTATVPFNISRRISLSAATTYYVLESSSSSSTNLYYDASTGPIPAGTIFASGLKARCAYL